MYANDRNALIVLALLKKYGIRKIVVSPGTTNAPIAGSVQADPYFEAYSVVDERSAAYFATGLAFETKEPVVISCTGSTASRNYLPALTEAYYRNLPIIALTSQNDVIDYGTFRPQSINRTVSPLDVKRVSVNLPIIKDSRDEEAAIFLVNKALTLATQRGGGGPVHINLIVSSFACNTADLPDIPKTDYYRTENLFSDECTSKLRNELLGKKIGLLIGCHRRFSGEEKEAVEKFIDSYDTTVFYDNTSNYHGKNKILLSVAAGLKSIKEKPEIVIDIGSVTPVYAAPYFLNGAEFWRVSEDGEFHQRCGSLKKQFDCPERVFFDTLARANPEKNDNEYYNSVTESTGEVIIPDLPLSNTLVSSEIAKKLPAGCSFHIACSETLSCMNMFTLKDTIDSCANVGAMGIDGAVSSLVGRSMADKEKLYFGQTGDLAFFYDMNILGNRHITSNMRLLLVNNGGGARFRISPSELEAMGEGVDELIGAFGHNGSAKGWAESMGFEYLSARTKENFLNQIDTFCSPDIKKFDKPVLFEVFTTPADEKKALELLREANKPPFPFRDKPDTLKKKVKEAIKNILPQKAVDIIKILKS